MIDRVSLFYEIACFYQLKLIRKQFDKKKEREKEKKKYYSKKIVD